MREGALRINHLIFGFSAGAIVSYILLSSPHTSSLSPPMLILFNFLFVALTFPLNGKLTRKLCILLMGNVIGLVWNYLFSLFAAAGANFFGNFFDALYIILNPFLNLIWIVSFWSMGLTALSDTKNRKGMG